MMAVQINHKADSGSKKFHFQPMDALFAEFDSSSRGLDGSQAAERLQNYGPNTLPTKPPPTLLQIFLQQFRNPLIYILGIAAIISVALGDTSDAVFIALVLMLNAIIGTSQEFSAEKSAQALRKMAAAKCMVERNGDAFEIDAETLVVGDIVWLESGRKVPADMRLFSSYSLEVDESLLTGESEPVMKSHDLILSEETSLADRKNMVFTGSLVTKGRGKGLVIATGLRTELGLIAESISHGEDSRPPLLIRMEKFTKKIAISLLIITLVMAIYLFLKGQSWHEVLIFSVAVAVSAIPEGLPVALTVALSIASRRMARRNVIVRKLPAVEALGSCSFIATDKTGTLTVNQLTIQKIAFPDLPEIEVTGTGLNPEGRVSQAVGVDSHQYTEMLASLVVIGTLCNESHLAQKDGKWIGYGDAVDLAFLVLAHKCGFNPNEIRDEYKMLKEIPFEPENQYAASLHGRASSQSLSVKGALEKVLPMCSNMLTQNGTVNLAASNIEQQAEALAVAGYRVLALAGKTHEQGMEDIEDELNELTFIGFVGMIDPLRPEAANAIDSCQRAGIDVAMVTGDHPITALAIARELKFAQDMNHVVTGPQLKQENSVEKKAALIGSAKVFARMEPQQKLEIVQHLIKGERFVAVTGDGANDAPALKAANVGVAMGQSGTDIAKETSDLIITDDRFATIVAGVEEGRIAYNNVRKVIYLLISTGIAEIILFSLALFFNTPLPLTAIQVLWLNLVTNGIQDVGLSFEPGEGDELSHKPRKPSEDIFDRLMLERIAISAAVMAIVTFAYYYQLISSGVEESSARNLTLLLMVLFENIMVGNCRSETKSAFRIKLLSNPILLVGTIIAQLIHIAALYIPTISDVLGTEPVSITEWLKLLLLASSVLAVMEVYKLLRRN